MPTLYHFYAPNARENRTLDAQELETVIRRLVGPLNGKTYDWSTAHKRFHNAYIQEITDARSTFYYDQDLWRTPQFKATVIQQNPWQRIFDKMTQDIPVLSTSMTDWLNQHMQLRDYDGRVELISLLSARASASVELEAPPTTDPVLQAFDLKFMNHSYSDRIDMGSELVRAINAHLPILAQAKANGKKL